MNSDILEASCFEFLFKVIGFSKRKFESRRWTRGLLVGWQLGEKQFDDLSHYLRDART